MTDQQHEQKPQDKGVDSSLTPGEGKALEAGSKHPQDKPGQTDGAPVEP